MKNKKEIGLISEFYINPKISKKMSKYSKSNT